MTLLRRALTLVKQNPILWVIVVIGFLLRIIGTSPGYYAHGYEVSYGQAVLMILNRTIGLEYNNLAYPPLVPWMMATSFLLFFIPLAWVGYLFNNFVDAMQLVFGGAEAGVDVAAQLGQIFRKEILGTRYWQNAMYWGRYLTVIFGTGSIVLSYKLVMEFFSKRVMALIAALMVAINYRLVLNSHMGFHDMYNVFFILLTLYATALLMKRPKPRYYMLASLSAGLTFLVKYQPAGFVALGVAHAILTAKKSKGKPALFIKNFFNREVVKAGIVTLAMILIAHINYFMRWDEVREWSSWVWTANETGKYMLYLFPFSYVYHTGLGKLLTLFSLGGIAFGIINKKYRYSTLILASVIVTTFYLFAFFSAGGYYTYNLLVPIAVFLIFASLFLEHSREWLVQKYRKRHSQFLITALYVLALVLALKFHFVNSAVSTHILAQPSYFVVAQEWLDKNIEGPAVFGGYTSNPAPQKADIEVVSLYHLQEAFGFQEFVQEKFDYALFDFWRLNEKFFWWMLAPPRMPTQFWSKPDNLLSQNYYALATRELLWNHTLEAFLPKWQAFGYNYAVTQINPVPDFADALVQKFSFSDSLEWTPLIFLEQNRYKLSWSEEGRTDKGSLVIKAGKEPKNNYWLTPPGGIRWESPSLPAKPGSGYKVSGWIKNAEDVEKKFRNGFLRLDFYEEDLQPSITNRPIISFVSSRVYGKSTWHKVEIQAVAPPEANFLRVGFQADDPSATFYLDNVEIRQTLDKPSLDDIKRFIIPDEDFFNPSDSSFI